MLALWRLSLLPKKKQFPDFEFSKKYNSLVSQKENVILVKPQTFMNESGFAVKKITQDHKSQLENIIIVHDDIDVVIGKLKIVKDRGSAGHKGIDSIIQNIGNENLIRFRVGIQPTAGKPANGPAFVIKKFTKEEQEVLSGVIEKTSQALEYFIENGLEKTMNKYN